MNEEGKYDPSKRTEFTAPVFGEKEALEKGHAMKIDLTSPENQAAMRAAGKNPEEILEAHRQTKERESATREALSQVPEPKVIVDESQLEPLGGGEEKMHARGISAEEMNKYREQMAQEGHQESQGFWGKVKRLFGKG